MNQEEEHSQRQDYATARRLAHLGRREIDVLGLERKLDAALLEAGGTGASLPPAADTLRGTRLRRWFRPVAGLAAAAALALTLMTFLPTNTSHASAVVELSRLHRDITAGRIELHTVSSAAEANRWIASQQRSVPALPEQFAGARVQSCCLADVQGRLVAVAQLVDAGSTVTLVVAQAPGFAHEMGQTVRINGRTFFGHELNGIRMMMANRNDRWLCVMGDPPYQDLAELASKIEF